MEAFTIRDFGGGLNTATDPSSLPQNMSPNLANVDLLDSKAIKKRSGYVIDTLSPIAAKPIHSLYRYYKKSGDRYWMAASNGNIYARQSADNEIRPILAEAEVLPRDGTAAVTTRYYASGGRVVTATGAVTFTIPPSTDFTMRSNASALAGVYVAVDGGAEVLASRSTYTVSGLAAAEHSVTVRPQARATSSLAVTVAAGSKCGYSIDTGANRLLTENPNDSVSIRFWDNGTTSPTGTWGVAFSNDGTDQRQIRHQIYRDGLANVYRYRPPFSEDALPVSNRAENVFISEGWHTVTLENGRIYLDGVEQGLCSKANARNVEVFVDATTSGAPALTAYFDTLTVNGVLVNDGSSTTGWTQVGTESYHDSVGTFSIASSGAKYDTDTLMAIDSFEYADVSSFVSLGSVTASSNTFAYTTLNDTCYVSSPYDTLMSYTGASLTTVTATNAPAVGFLAQKGRRLFGAGNAADPSKLYYTELDKPEDWGVGTQNGIYLAGKDAGGACTGLAVWSDLLFYFGESTLWALSTQGTPDQWEAKSISAHHGCVAPKSIAVAPNAVIFLAADGVRAYGTAENIYSDDGSLLMLLSDNINPSIMAYTDAQRKEARGAVYRNRYWLSIGSDTYICDLEKRTEQGQPPWTLYTGLDINCFAVTRSDEYGLYAGSQSNGHVYRLDTGGHDNGSPIPMLYETPPFAPKGFTTVKHFKHLHLAALSPLPSALSVLFTTDDVSAPDATVVMTSETDRRPERVLVPSRGRSAAITMHTSGANQDVTISEVTVTYNPVPRVR